eukprot:gb/GECG01004235.1/.p1 GENE.gb/GECG01004235.1/~~gb/GECG01004235.1/.p1  ORF type:complete len:103 (+),score=6.23 gb/GECG01004235.1/:1-309(+)
MANQAAKKGAQRASRALTIWISVVIAVYATYLPVAFYVDDPTSWSWLYFAWQAALGVTYYVAITGIASSAEQGNEGAYVGERDTVKTENRGHALCYADCTTT